jgi:hypothetical protein
MRICCFYGTNFKVAPQKNSCTMQRIMGELLGRGFNCQEGGPKSKRPLLFYHKATILAVNASGTIAASGCDFGQVLGRRIGAVGIAKRRAAARCLNMQHFADKNIMCTHVLPRQDPTFEVD